MGALDALGIVEQAIDRLTRIDPSVQSLADQLAEAIELLNDLEPRAGTLSGSGRVQPPRLQQVEERLQMRPRPSAQVWGRHRRGVGLSSEAAGELKKISHAEERVGKLKMKSASPVAGTGQPGG